MVKVMEAVTLARALRQERNLRVRQPLSSLVWVARGDATEDQMAPFLQIIADELNVNSVKLRHDDRDLVTRSATANFKTLGKRVGPRMPEIAKVIAALTDEQIIAIESGGTFRYEEFEFTLDDIQIRRIERPGLALKSDGYMTVALDTTLTPELEAEGMAREVVHHIQNLRKQSGFEITDRIAVVIGTASSQLEQALLAHRKYICRETLALELELKGDVTGTTLDSNGHSFAVSIRRVTESSKNLTAI
jgi:isoleucyl-tRNA synthetase